MFDKIKDFEIRISPFTAKIQKAKEEAAKRIVGQEDMIHALLTGMLTGGHILLEGLPGLAKTLAVKTLADITSLSFKRIQFTPDMLPADILGTQVYRPQDGTFFTKKGPLFAHLVLADEINRSPAKVQSALLEVMQEKQVTLAGQVYKMDEPFLVLATQNPLDQEGTYPLPEAQLDRFMMKVVVGYPSPEDEKLILDRYIDLQELPPVEPLLSAEEITEIKKYISQVYVDEKIRQYIVRLIHATRYPDEHGLSDLSAFIAVGASPRATLTLAAGSKAVAFMEGKGYVSPHEIKSIIRHILRHRIKLTFEASASGVNIEDIIERITLSVKVP